MKHPLPYLACLLLFAPHPAQAADPPGGSDPWTAIPELKAQAYEMELLIEAVKTAREVRDFGEGEKKLYRVRDALDELQMLASGRMAESLEKHPNRKWSRLLLLNFLTNHSLSAQEGWTPVVCRLCVDNRPATIDLFGELGEPLRDQLVRRLSSPLNDYKPEVCKKLGQELSELK